jgi:outer membrane protein assembly factor BamA
LALIACIALSAQTAGTFRIDSVTYDISGSTREYPLRRLADIDKKRVFLSQQELDVYVNNLRTKLQNERVFESTSVDVSLGQAGADGIVPVSLVVHTKDTWNIIVLPYPKYDSNDGFTIKLKLKDFNFFGSLQTLSADVNYQLDTTDKAASRRT